MKTLIKTNEFGNVTKSFYNDAQSAIDAGNSFLRDCTIHAEIRKNRSIKIIDFEFEKYGFSKMPIFAQYEKNNLGLFVNATIEALQGKRIIVSNQVSEL